MREGYTRIWSGGIPDFAGGTHGDDTTVALLFLNTFKAGEQQKSGNEVAKGQ